MAKCQPNANQIMETPASFDLDRALVEWRVNLQELGSLHLDELEELEGHLRESVSILHARGLPIQESFMIAARRLGSERQLSNEFAKANPQRIWTERAMWMVAGVLVAHTLSILARPLPAILTGCALRAGLDGYLAGALQLLTSCFAWMGLAAIAYWLLGRQSSWRDRLVAAAIRSPVLIGLGLFIGLEYLQHLMMSVYRLADPLDKLLGVHNHAINPRTIAIMNSWSAWESFLRQLLWIGAGPLLVGYAWRKHNSRVSEAPVHYELQPDEQDAAHTLEIQGLSRDEAGLVLGHRRGSNEGVAWSLVGETPSVFGWSELFGW